MGMIKTKMLGVIRNGASQLKKNISNNCVNLIRLIHNVKIIKTISEKLMSKMWSPYRMISKSKNKMIKKKLI